MIAALRRRWGRLIGTRRARRHRGPVTILPLDGAARPGDLSIVTLPPDAQVPAGWALLDHAQHQNVTVVVYRWVDGTEPPSPPPDTVDWLIARGVDRDNPFIHP